MTSLFAQPAKSATPSLFGAPANNTTTPQKSLFGGATTTTTTAAPATGGLFGASQPATTTPSLFGAANTTAAKPAGSALFGAANPTSAQPASTSLFGGANTAQPASTSLFGAPKTTTQPATTSLFGTAQPSQSTSLFGGNTQQSNAAGSSLFGSKPLAQSFNQPGTASSQQPQVNKFAGALGQGLSMSSIGPLTSQQQREFAQSRLQAVGLNSAPREKTVQQQVETLYNKWSPQHPDNLMQTYLYNAANPAFAPFYHPEVGEDERKYEEALAKKPEAVDGNTWVPVLVRGFEALGKRIEFQARTVQSMQMRLHEMNNALSAIIQKHSQDLTVRIDASKRQHQAISARTLRLAVKCQILRNRGYALDVQEEALRTTLLGLEKNVNDPSYTSREEEIWARLLVLRERSKWLEEEGKRLGNAANGQVDANESLPAEVVTSAKRILGDYDSQIKQLTKEVDEVQQELQEWSEARAR